VALTILAADDSVTMRKVLEMTFAGEDATVVTVSDADAAIQRAGELSPDLVLADAVMPGMDGYDLCRSLKTNPATRGAAVIVLSSQHHPFDADKGRQCGVDDHILKPYDTQALIDKARQVLAKPRAAAQAGAPATAAAPSAPPSTPFTPTAPSPRRTSARGVSRPAGTSPRSTVAFDATAPSSPPPRPVLELDTDDAPEPVAKPARTAPPLPRTSFTKPTTPPRPEGPKPTFPPRPAVAPSGTPASRAVAPPSATPEAPAPAAAATAVDGDMAARLAELGLDADQASGVLALTREVIERVVWEVVPDLAETIIREEIARLTAE
jgi:CheY-like chemotaxis protein